MLRETVGNRLIERLLGRGVAPVAGDDVDEHRIVSADTADRLNLPMTDPICPLAVSPVPDSYTERMLARQSLRDLEARLKDSTAGRCELEDGPSLSAETVRRLACDASLVTVIENDQGEPLSVGRKTRTISPALRRALNARDRGCRYPGSLELAGARSREPAARSIDRRADRHYPLDRRVDGLPDGDRLSVLQRTTRCPRFRGNRYFGSRCMKGFASSSARA